MADMFEEVDAGNGRIEPRITLPRETPEQLALRQKYDTIRVQLNRDLATPENAGRRQEILRDYMTRLQEDSSRVRTSQRTLEAGQEALKKRIDSNLAATQVAEGAVDRNWIKPEQHGAVDSVAKDLTRMHKMMDRAKLVGFERDLITSLQDDVTGRLHHTGMRATSARDLAATRESMMFGLQTDDEPSVIRNRRSGLKPFAKILPDIGIAGDRMFRPSILESLDREPSAPAKTQIKDVLRPAAASSAKPPIASLAAEPRGMGFLESLSHNKTGGRWGRVAASLATAALALYPALTSDTKPEAEADNPNARGRITVAEKTKAAPITAAERHVPVKPAEPTVSVASKSRTVKPIFAAQASGMDQPEEKPPVKTEVAATFDKAVAAVGVTASAPLVVPPKPETPDPDQLRKDNLAVLRSAMAAQLAQISESQTPHQTQEVLERKAPPPAAAPAPAAGI
jgi:hypothetical protein